MNTKQEIRTQLLSKALTEKLTNLILIAALLATAVIVTNLAEAQTIDTIPSRVDPIRRSYLLFETDKVGSLKLHRVYSSRSIFRGHFGIGWCSSLDANLVLSVRGPEYRGCDMRTADRVDARKTNVTIQRTSTGFRRETEHGQIQLFDLNGRLVLLKQGVQSTRIHRNAKGQMIALSTVSRKVSEVWDVSMELTSESLLEETLILSIGPYRRYSYSDGLLTEVRSWAPRRKEFTRMAYDEILNLTTVNSDRGDEAIVYNTETDELISVTRTTAFGRDRLVLGERSTALATSGRSSEVEIRIEMKRGVEIHPVRILYDRKTQDLVFEGSRLWVKQIFDWLSA